MQSSPQSVAFLKMLLGKSNVMNNTKVMVYPVDRFVEYIAFSTGNVWAGIRSLRTACTFLVFCCCTKACSSLSAFLNKLIAAILKRESARRALRLTLPMILCKLHSY